MSKWTKFLSIAIDILSGSEAVKGEGMAIEDLSKFLLWLEELCNHHDLHYQKKILAADYGKVYFQVQDEDKIGVNSQVKLYQVKAGEAVTDYQSENFNAENYNAENYNAENYEAEKYVADYYGTDKSDTDKSDTDKYDTVNHNAMNYGTVTGRKRMLRRITDRNGSLEVTLPAGNYYAEISKGSEYEIIGKTFKVLPGKSLELSEKLKPIIKLKEKGWYCGDLHHHSIFSSPVYGGDDPVVETPEEVYLSMLAMGSSFGALSDHHNILNHKIWKRFQSERFLPVISKEISTSNGHVMAMGAEEDVIYQIPAGKDRTDKNLRKEFIRVVDQIRLAGGLPQINHPREHSSSISWNENYNDILPIFDTMEVWNGSNPMMPGTTNGKAFTLWLSLLEQGIFIPATAGSDTHNILADNYQEYFEKFHHLAETVQSGQITIPKELESEELFLLRINNYSLPIMEKWANTNLSTAGVRNYVYVEEKLTQENLLTALRAGHSFITNGPILIPEIAGKFPGDIVKIDSTTKEINLTIIGNRPLKTLYLYTNGGRKKRSPLKLNALERGKYDYSTILTDFETKNLKWMFFQVDEDCTNMAITNPIFFEI